MGLLIEDSGLKGVRPLLFAVIMHAAVIYIVKTIFSAAVSYSGRSCIALRDVMDEFLWVQDCGHHTLLRSLILKCLRLASDRVPIPN